jgi:NifU-like protein
VKFYPQKIAEKTASLAHAGRTESANAVGTGVGLTCGAFVRFYIRVDAEGSEILEARFQTNGCGFAIASAETLAEQVTGTDLTRLHGLNTTEFTAHNSARLGEFPPERGHCAGIALDALRAALADYRAFRLKEYSGEKALICTCFGISEETIEQAIAEKSPGSIEEVTRLTRAGGGCGSCCMLIQEMLDTVER